LAISAIGAWNGPIEKENEDRRRLRRPWIIGNFCQFQSYFDHLTQQKENVKDAKNKLRGSIIRKEIRKFAM